MYHNDHVTLATHEDSIWMSGGILGDIWLVGTFLLEKYTKTSRHIASQYHLYQIIVGTGLRLLT